LLAAKARIRARRYRRYQIMTETVLAYRPQPTSMFPSGVPIASYTFTTSPSPTNKKRPLWLYVMGMAIRDPEYSMSASGILSRVSKSKIEAPCEGSCTTNLACEGDTEVVTLLDSLSRTEDRSIAYAHFRMWVFANIGLGLLCRMSIFALSGLNAVCADSREPCT
jgi:hypothetical protein